MGQKTADLRRHYQKWGRPDVRGSLAGGGFFDDFYNPAVNPKSDTAFLA
jgi:hypothetical protein